MPPLLDGSSPYIYLRRLRLIAALFLLYVLVSSQLLGQSLPSLSVVESDVLQVDYTKLAELRGGPLSVIGNLPYHITSQVRI